VDRGSAQCVTGGTRLAQLENAIANDVSPDRFAFKTASTVIQSALEPGRLISGSRTGRDRFVDDGSAQCVPGGTRLAQLGAQLENAIANGVSPDRLNPDTSDPAPSR
jgi:hypothetical protein